jgi:microcystin-dependent protein
LLQTGAGALAGLALAESGALGRPAPAAAAPAPAPDEVLPGEVRLFAADYAPRGWERVPNLAGRALMGSGDPPDGPPRRVGERGGGSARRSAADVPASLNLTYLRATEKASPGVMIGEIRPFAFPDAPSDWLPCDGRLLKSAQFIVLFAVLAGEFGSDDMKTFWLPDLRVRTPLDAGDGDALPATPFGKRGEGLDPDGKGRAPRLHLNYCIAHWGEFPDRDRG